MQRALGNEASTHGREREREKEGGGDATIMMYGDHPPFVRTYDKMNAYNKHGFTVSLLAKSHE